MVTARRSPVPSTPTGRYVLEHWVLVATEDCLLRECDHDYTADCVDDFRARLSETAR